MSNDFKTLSYEELAGRARGTGNATRDATVRALASVVADLCQRLTSTEKRLEKVEQRNNEIRGRLRALEDVITNAVSSRTLRSVLDQLQNRSVSTQNFDVGHGYSEGIDRLEKLLIAKMSG